jgi:FkbM family methyltransferase
MQAVLERVAQRVRDVPPLVGRWRLTGDLASARRLSDVEGTSSMAGTVPPIVRHIRIRELEGVRVGIREGTMDCCALRGTFEGRYHLPPEGIVPERILDLGANIGMTMAHYAVLYPHADVVGVELDPLNAALARENLRPWSDRCELVEGAVWTHDGEVSYARERGNEQGFRVVEGDADATAPAFGIGTLLDRRRWESVDFVKMDIEGAERAVLADGTGWADRVRSIKVEIHEPYRVEDAVRDLAALGFDVRADERHWAAAIGVRRNG